MNNPEEALPSPNGSSGRLLGALLLLHFVVVFIIKTINNEAADMFWMSHVGLLTVALGLAFSVPLLVTAAFIELLVLHGLWLFDCLSWFATGEFPMGLATYLEGADVLVWIATAHHFFLLPMLIVLVRRRPARPREAVLCAIATYLIITTISRAFLEPSSNINYAFGVRISWQHAFWDWANHNSKGPLYLLGLNIFVTFVMFLPAFGLVCLWQKRSQRHIA